MNPGRVCSKTSLPRDKNVVVTCIQLKPWLALTGIFQLIITVPEPSLLCCFAPSSESSQEAEPWMSWLSYSSPTHGMPGSLRNTPAKSSADRGRVPREGGHQPFPGLLKQLKPGEEETRTTAGKSPSGWIGDPVTRDPAFPRKLRCRTSEEIRCIIGSGEFSFPVWLPGFLIAQKSQHLVKML